MTAPTPKMYEAYIANLKRQIKELRSPCMGCSVREAQRDRYRKALEHIAVHGEHGEECRRPPQDCAADALNRPEAPDA